MTGIKRERNDELSRQIDEATLIGRAVGEQTVGVASSLVGLADLVRASFPQIEAGIRVLGLFDYLDLQAAALEKLGHDSEWARFGSHQVMLPLIEFVRSRQPIGDCGTDRHRGPPVAHCPGDVLTKALSFEELCHRVCDIALGVEVEYLEDVWMRKRLNRLRLAF